MNIFFDLDDTLIPTQPLYDKARLKAVNYIKNLYKDLKEEKILETFLTIDGENVRRYGFSKDRLPTSWEETLRELVDNPAELQVNKP